MANHSHGLWGYSRPDRRGPPAHRPVDRDRRSERRRGPARARRARGSPRDPRRLRAGARAGLAERTPVVVSAALRGDGASRALGAVDPVTPGSGPDRGRWRARSARAEVIVLSRDLDDPPETAPAHPPSGRGASLADLETAALLAAGERAGVAVAAALVVARRRPRGARARRLLELGSAGVAALVGARAGVATQDCDGAPAARSARELVGDLVEAVLELLDPPRERAQALLEPLELRGRGKLRAPIAERCAWAARSPAPSALFRAELNRGLSISAWARSADRLLAPRTHARCSLSLAHRGAAYLQGAAPACRQRA